MRSCNGLAQSDDQTPIGRQRFMAAAREAITAMAVVRWEKMTTLLLYRAMSAVKEQQVMRVAENPFCEWVPDQDSEESDHGGFSSDWQLVSRLDQAKRWVSDCHRRSQATAPPLVARDAERMTDDEHFQKPWGKHRGTTGSR